MYNRPHPAIALMWPKNKNKNNVIYNVYTVKLKLEVFTRWTETDCISEWPTN